MLPHWTENTIDVAGIRIHYTRTGDGNKPPLVLAHGFSDNGMCWLPVARDLEAEYDVILPDAHGHGKSARLRVEDPMDMPADLAGLIRVLELKQPVVGGHSMGGSVSAVTGLLYPELVRALVLEDPGWHTPAPKEEAKQPPSPNPWMEWLLGVDKLSLEEIMAKCRADSPNWPEVELRPWAESKQELDKSIFTTARAEAHDWREVAAGLKCPTLLLTAEVEKGAIVSAEMAAQARSLNPLIEVVKISGAGHSIRRDQYADFMKAVRSFLKSLV